MSKILLEGINGAGKSTLASILQNRGFKVRHFDYDVHDVLTYANYIDAISNIMDGEVWDRSFISSIVYEKALRNNLILKFEEQIALYKYLGNLGISIVYLYADYDVLVQRRIAKNNALYILENFYHELIRQFDLEVRIAKYHCDVVSYDTTAQDVAHLYKQCLHCNENAKVNTNAGFQEIIISIVKQNSQQARNILLNRKRREYDFFGKQYSFNPP